MPATEIAPDVKSYDDKLEYGHKPVDNSDQSSGEELATVDKGYTDVIVELSPEEGRRILHKIDVRLVPVLSLLYLVAFIDRSNIGNAKIAGLSKDLNLTGLQYNTAVTMFFVSYGFFVSRQSYRWPPRYYADLRLAAIAWVTRIAPKANLLHV
ncbi:hypothetical protein LTR10_011355 [Elasticomyces elasticus]|nr:hypothetical protein LTR10_011355 [Elasticomyces elasticus]